MKHFSQPVTIIRFSENNSNYHCYRKLIIIMHRTVKGKELVFWFGELEADC